MRILFLAYYYPPDSSSGAFRPLFFANHLSELGDKVYILTVNESDFLQTQPRDHRMLEKVDPDVEVVRSKARRPREALLSFRDRLKKSSGPAKDMNPDSQPLSKGAANASSSPGALQALKDTLTDLLATPDPHVGWVPYCVRQGKKIVRENNIDVILATSSPWSSLLAGAWIKKKTKVPLVLDFRDPWVSNPGFSQRGELAAGIDKRLEKFVVRFADSIIANTQELAQDFVTRFQLNREKVYCIPNGFEQFEAPRSRKHAGTLSIAHLGALYFTRDPKPLLRAVADLTKSKELPVDKFRLLLVGGIDSRDQELEEILVRSNLQKVLELTPRLPYSEAQRYMLVSDVLLLIQPDFPLQIPRKLYEYMAARRPVLCIAEPEGATAKMVREYELGWVVQNDYYEISKILQEIYGKWWEHGLSPLEGDKLEPFLNSNLSIKLKKVLERVNED